MIRLGLVGCGAWGRNFLRAAEEAGNCRVTWTCSRTAPGPGSTRHVHDWREMLGAPVDGFVVATPPETHAEVALTLLSSGRPVMLEKPATLGIASAEAIAHEVELRHGMLLVDHQHLFAPAYEMLRDVVRAGTPEQVDVCGMGGGAGPERSYSALWDYGPHDVAMVVGLAGHARWRVFDFPEISRPGLFDFGMVSAPSRPLFRARISVWADRGPKVRSLVVHSAGQRLIYDDRSEEKLNIDGRVVPVSLERPLTRAVRAFGEAVRTGRTDWRFGGAWAVSVASVLSAVEACRSEGTFAKEA